MAVDLGTQLARADAALARFVAEPLGHFIGGRPVAGTGEAFENRSPVDGRALGIAEDLGFPLGDPQRLEAVMDCDFDAVRARARMYHADMRRFLATLQR